MSENGILPDLSDEPLEVRTLYPNPEYRNSWGEATKEKEDEVKEILQDSDPDILGVTHTDADGYGAEVMLREAYPNKNVEVVTASQSGPEKVENIGDTISDLVDTDTEVFIMDLSPETDNADKFVNPFRNFPEFHVVDHHEWSENDAEQINWVADVLHDTERCATQIVHDEILDDPRPEITELAEITADHDLWIKEMRERSNDLSALANFADREEYVNLALEHGSEILETDRGRAIINEAQEKQRRETELALSRTTHYDVNGKKLSIAYGRCDPSDVGEVLYDEMDADLACIVFPSGNVSFRTPDDNPVAREIAVEFGGGGHECAAGASLAIVGSSVNETTFWATKGRAARDILVETAKKIL